MPNKAISNRTTGKDCRMSAGIIAYNVTCNFYFVLKYHCFFFLLLLLQDSLQQGERKNTEQIEYSGDIFDGSFR